LVSLGENSFLKWTVLCVVSLSLSCNLLLVTSFVSVRVVRQNSDFAQNRFTCLAYKILIFSP